MGQEPDLIQRPILSVIHLSCTCRHTEGFSSKCSWSWLCRLKLLLPWNLNRLRNCTFHKKTRRQKKNTWWVEGQVIRFGAKMNFSQKFVFFAFRNVSQIALKCLERGPKSLVSCYIKFDPFIISHYLGSAWVPPSSAETSGRNKNLNGWQLNPRTFLLHFCRCRPSFLPWPPLGTRGALSLTPADGVLLTVSFDHTVTSQSRHMCTQYQNYVGQAVFLQILQDNQHVESVDEENTDLGTEMWSERNVELTERLHSSVSMFFIVMQTNGAKLVMKFSI